MQNANEPRLLSYGDWTIRLRPAQSLPGHLMVMLHGWTGDENSMWIFARNLPLGYTILAPRAPFKVRDSGYTWRKTTAGDWGKPSLDDLRPGADGLLTFLDAWAASASLEASWFDLMGFSQGAALTYALALLHPGRVRALAALSGALPGGVESLLAARPLAGKPVFVAHGRQDDLIPVERARKSVAQLEQSGARVTYCEANGGHKVAAGCLERMESFFSSIYNHDVVPSR